MKLIAGFRTFVRGSFLMVLITHGSSTFAQYNSSEEKKALLLELARKHAPDALQILESSGPQEDFTIWVNGSNREAVLEAFDTVIHETCHYYNIRRSNFEGHSYFIGDSISIHVLEGPLFNSRELNELVPRKLQKKIFRYETYVGGGDEDMSSQIKGIYGLLEEFCAYYHGAKAGLELYDDYQSRCGFQEADCWVKGYLRSLMSPMSSFQEFRLFLTWYLHYAQKKHPDVFEACMRNQALRVAFTLLYDRFQVLKEEYARITQEIIQKLNLSGKKVEIIGNAVRVYNNGGYSQFSASENDDDDLLEREFKKYDQGMLSTFRIEGVNLENYKEFIKN